MYHLINPGGRIVVVDDKDQYKKLLTKGFEIPTDDEIEAYQNNRQAQTQKKQKQVEKELGIYMATVSQGGKDGYGVASERLIKELEARGVNISLYNNKQKIGFLFHAPYSLMRLENDVRIIYTMFESDQIPDDWPELLNTADLVIVPSHWCMEVFAKKGVNAQVIPLGYDDKIFKYKKRRNKRITHEPFVFLHYNAFNVRKGFIEVVKAFQQAFDPSEPVKLILKTALDRVPIPFPKSQYPNIEVITGKMSDKELAELCNRSDCFVFPSRGEGFGIPPLEAMATGMPAIVPNAHGITEYFNDKCMYEVKIKERSAAIYSRYKGRDDVGHMVTCDADHLASQMRYIYEHQDEAAKKGETASEYVKNFTFEKTAESLKAVFDDYMEKDIEERPLKNVLVLEEA